MFHMNQNLKVVLAAEPVDLRKSFNGLYVIARNELGRFLKMELYLFSPTVHEPESRCCVSMEPGAGCP